MVAELPAARYTIEVRRHGPLLLAWCVDIVLCVAGFVGESPGLIALSYFAALLLAVITVRHADLDGQLRHVRVYRLTLGLLLACAIAAALGAGSTVFVSVTEGLHVAGLIVLATINVGLAVAAWRALLQPHPRRAAKIGAFAILELFALVVDAVINIGYGNQRLGPHPEADIALWASLATTVVGVFACIVSLVAFEDAGEVRVPPARLVDRD